MSVYNLDRMFQPKSIAVIGASEKAGSVGASVMQNLIAGGFTGEIYPVNPRYRKVYRRKVYHGIRSIDATIDMAVIATPINTVPWIIKECATINCGGAVIISAGGKEIGAEGAGIEERIKQAAGQSNLRIIGPNCLGIVCSKSNLNASFAGRMPKPGKMAFISQSGAICTSILDFAEQENMGFSYFVSLGSMLDTDFGDIIDFIGNDPEVSSIVMYIESLTRFRNFMSAARAVSRIKPIIVFKAGRSNAGAMAAASHTGAMAGEDDVYDAAFRRAGIVRVKTFEELFDCAEFISKQPKPIGNGLAIVTNSGGPGVMAVDSLSDYGVEPVHLQPETIRRLDDFLPKCWSRSNPVDILGDASRQRYRKAVEVLLEDNNINGLLIMFSPQALSDPAEVAENLTDILVHRKIPVITAWMGGVDVDKGRKIFNRAGISTFDTPERAVRAFMDLYKYSRINRMLQEIPSSLPHKLDFNRNKAAALIQRGLETKSGMLVESDARQLLTAYGIPVNPAIIAIDEDKAVRLAVQIGFPVALKIHSADIIHKTDVGGIVLDVADEKQVRDAYARIIRNVKNARPDAGIEGVTIQKMLSRSGYELIAGAKKDRDFGPVLLFGMGGIFTEVIKDRSIALPPINRLLAKRLIDETKISHVLKGYRNLPGVNLMLLEEILIRLSQLVTDFSEIEEIDINPLIAGVNGIVAADARVLVKASPVKAPLHLVISPYPNQYENRIEIKGEGSLLIRPIRPEDAPLLESLFVSLSPQSVYFRFFSPMKRLPHHMLARFTQIDYDREVALVAIKSSGSEDQMLGVARIIPDYDGKNAEFAVIVGDQWHGKGIGAQLLERCLAMAWKSKIERVWGQVMTDNVNMLALGRKLGFSIKLIPGSNSYELSLRFNRNDKETSDRFERMQGTLNN
jgi:acetyltransferase